MNRRRLRDPGDAGGEAGILRALARRAPYLLPPLAAVVLYWPTLSWGWMADDPLLNLVLDRGSDSAAPRVVWSEALADFGRPFTGNAGLPLYRPLVPLTYATDYTLGGGSPAFFHGTNVTLHALTCLLVALLARELCGGPRRAGIGLPVLAGVAAAVHPASMEAVGWIAGRSAGISVAFQTACVWAFLVARRTGNRAWLFASGLAAALALGAVEGAVALPLCLLAADLLRERGEHETHRRWRWLRAHAALLPVWILYLLVRVTLLDSRVLMHAFGPRLSTATLRHLGSHVATAIAPGATPGWPTWSVVVGLAGVLACALGSRAALRVVAIVLLWIVAALLPVAGHGDTVVPGRLHYSASAILAAELVLVCVRSRRGARVPAGLGIGLVAAGFTGQLFDLRAEYGFGSEDVATAAHELREAGAGATPERPLAVFRIPRRARVPLPTTEWFGLLERPFAERDVPAAFVEFGFSRYADVVEEVRDADGLRMTRRAGSRLAAWVPWGRTIVVADPLPPAGDFELLRWNPGFAFAGAPVAALDVEGFELELEGPPTGGTLRWRSADFPAARTDGIRFAAGAPESGGRVWVDVAPSVEFLLAGRLWGVEIDLDDAAARVLFVRSAALRRELEPPQRLAGREVRRVELSKHLRAPTLQADEAGLELELVLVGPATRAVFGVEPGAAVELPPKLVAFLDVVLRASRQRLFYFVFRTRDPRGSRPTACSTLDHVRLLP